MNRRKTLLSLLAFSSLGALPLQAVSQESAKLRRIGFLSVGSPTDNPQFREALLQGLSELGHVEGRNIAFEWRYADRRPERLPALAAELVRLKVDVIVAETPPTSEIAKQATSTIPIVFGISADPVREHLVASLARPGGNATGLSTYSPAVVGKQLELLKQIAPNLSHVAILKNPGNPAHSHVLQEAESAARSLGLQLHILQAGSAQEIDAAFVSIHGRRAGGVLVMRDALFLAQRSQIAALATKNRLPAVYGVREHAVAGGLLVYGANAPQMFRRVASFVDKILKGARPADLPVEQPTKFDMVINMKSAKNLGINIPQSVLLLADEIIK